MRRVLALGVVVLSMAVSQLVFADEALARAGRGGSSGSRGSRSPSAPARSAPGSITGSHSAPAVPREPTPAPAGWGGGVPGFLIGGLLGGLLLGGGAGVGLLDIVGLALLGWLALKMLRRRAETASAAESWSVSGARALDAPAGFADGDPEAGVDRARHADPDFDRADFAATASEMFSKVQAAWNARDIAAIGPLLTPEMQSALHKDANALAAQGRTHHVERMTVRATEVVEAWQEERQDYVTVRFAASLVDYTVDDATGHVVEGSRDAAIQFEEFWTFTRPVWAKAWRLRAIQQAVPASS